MSIENHAPRANIQDRGQPCATVRVDKCLSTEGAKAYYLSVGPFFPGRVDWEIICALASGGSRTMNFFTNVDLTDEHLDILTCSIHTWCVNRRADPEGHLARAATTLALEVISACPSITSSELLDLLLAEFQTIRLVNGVESLGQHDGSQVDRGCAARCRLRVAIFFLP